MKKFIWLKKTIFLGGIIVILFNFKCINSGTEKPKEITMSKPTITEVQKKHQNSIMSIPGVVGMGIGAENGNQVIKIMVKRKTPELIQKVPAELDGFKVIIEEVGEIKAL